MSRQVKERIELSVIPSTECDKRILGNEQVTS